MCKILTIFFVNSKERRTFAVEKPNTSKNTMKQIPVREGLNTLLQFMTMKGICDACSPERTSVWMHQRLTRKPNSRPGTFYYFNEDNVAELNSALQEIVRNLEYSVTHLPKFHKSPNADDREECREAFRLEMLDITRYIQSHHLADLTDIRFNRWTQLMTMSTTAHRLWFKDDHIKAIRARVKEVACLLQDIELVYEQPLRP